jgi:hypothetical protein
MIGHPHRWLLIVIAVASAIALGRVGSAGAVVFPAHSSPAPTWCIADSTSGVFDIARGQAVINSGYPSADPMPNAGTSVVYLDDSGRVGVTYGDEEIDFRIWASWWDGTRWQYRAGNWMRKFNHQLVWQVQSSDGSWYYPTAGVNWVPQPGDGDIAESRIVVDAGRTYWVGYEYYWGRFSGSTFAGADDLEWYTRKTC